MSKAKTISRCPKCNTLGAVVDAIKKQVKVECPNCKHRWNTPSMMCYQCGKPNHYVSDGICVTCYSARRKAN